MTEVGVSDTAAPRGFTIKELKPVVTNLSKGKCPGHDGVGVEHLLIAGLHIYRIPALLFTFCVHHTYLTSELTESIIVRVIKNKPGDVSDKTYKKF